MALIIPIVVGFCPNCRRTVRLSTIEPHPIRDEVLIHTFSCNLCGPVMSIVKDRANDSCEVIRNADLEHTLALGIANHGSGVKKC